MDEKSSLVANQNAMIGSSHYQEKKAAAEIGEKRHDRKMGEEVMWEASEEEENILKRSTKRSKDCQENEEVGDRNAGSDGAKKSYRDSVMGDTSSNQWA